MASPIKPVRGKAGVFVIAGTEKVIKLVEWREDNLYDTVEVTPTTGTAGSLAAMTAGTEFEFFDSLSNKKKRDTNLNKQHALPAGWELIVTKLGVYAHTAIANTTPTPADLKKFYETFTLEAKINDTTIADGWVLGYQTGIGLYGSSVESGQGVISPGTPSIGAAPTLLVPQEINDGHDIRGKLRYDSYAWLANTTGNATQATFSTYVLAKLIFRGFLKRPLSKG
jgi:hypothetical protein